MAKGYDDGTEHAFADETGEGVLHAIDGPSVDGRVMRWSVDLGSADAGRALRELAERLAEIAEIRVQRIVVGVETVG